MFNQRKVFSLRQIYSVNDFYVNKVRFYNIPRTGQAIYFEPNTTLTIANSSQGITNYCTLDEMQYSY